MNRREDYIYSNLLLESQEKIDREYWQEIKCAIWTAVAAYVLAVLVLI